MLYSILLQTTSLFTLQRLDDFGGDTNGNAEIRNVACDNGSGTDCASLSNVHARHDGNTTSDPAVATDADGESALEAGLTFGQSGGVGAAID